MILFQIYICTGVKNMNALKISILIGSRNRANILRHCLKSLLSQDYEEFEIIILDDASEESKAYVNVINEFGDQRIRLMRSEKPLGVSGSRNVLMQHASGDAFFIIDDDAYLCNNDSLSKIAEIFGVKNEIGIIACKILNQGVVDKTYVVPFSQRELKKNPNIVDKGQYVGYFLGGAHAIHKNVIKMCGGYDSMLFFGEEELDLSYRAISLGWKIWYEPSIFVYHKAQASVLGREGEFEELYHHVKNRFYLAWRYLPGQYGIPYIGLWMGKYFYNAIREGSFGSYFGGILAGLHLLIRTPREPLDRQSINYLKNNFGRLWY